MYVHMSETIVFAPPSYAKPQEARKTSGGVRLRSQVSRNLA